MSALSGPFRAGALALALMTGTIGGPGYGQSVSAPPPPTASAFASASSHPLAEVDEEEYLLLRLETREYLLGEDIEGYRLQGGGYCLDLAQLSAALEFPIDVDADAARASGWFRSEDRAFSLSPTTVVFGGETERIEGRELQRHPGGLCVESASAARWFGLELEHDLAGSIVRVASKEKLPVELAREREKRRAALGRNSEALDLDARESLRVPYRMWRTPSVDLIARGRISRSGSRRGWQQSNSYNLLAAGEALGASFDARLSANASVLPEVLRLRAYRQDAEGRLFGSLQLTEIVAGDVTLQRSGGLVPTGVGRGAFLSNAPLVRAADFDTTSLFGELPPGWEAELYRNGALIAFSEPSDGGRYEFRDISLLYGDNLFEIVLYGPQGQVRRQTVMRRVGSDFVPPGKTWVSAGIVQDGRNLVDLRGSSRGPSRLQAVVSAEHGVSRSLSIGGALHLVEDPGRGPARPFAELSLKKSFGNALVELDAAANARGGKAVNLRSSGRVGTLSYFASTLFQDRLIPGTREGALTGRHEVRLIKEFDLQGAPTAVDFRAKYETFERSPDALSVDVRASTAIGRVQVSQALSWRQPKGSLRDDQLVGRTQLSGRMGKILLRAGSEYGVGDGIRFRGADATASYRLKSDSELRARARYDGDAKRASLAVGYARKFERFSLGAEVEADR